MRRVGEFRITTRGRVVAWWIRLWGGTVGQGLRVEKHVRLRHLPGPGLCLGDGVFLGVGVILDVLPDAELIIGSHVKLMHYALVGAAESVSIGDHSQIAEHSSVRDNNHDISPHVLMVKAPVKSAPVRIGQDVWVGRGVAVLRGVTIGDHAVVGANAVVRSDVEEYAVVGGVPAKHLKFRRD